MTTDNMPVVTAKAPVTPMWICLILAWIFFILPIPFTILIAAPLNLAAFILAIICLARSRVAHGVMGLVGTTIGAALLYFIGVGAMVMVTAAGVQAEQQRQTEQTVAQVAQATDVIEIGAAQLISDYNANEVSADDKYKGKIFQITGIIESIGKDRSDTPYVSLRSGSSSVRKTAQCFFSKGQESQLANLKKGDSVKIRGKVDGLMTNVLVKGSQIVP